MDAKGGFEVNAVFRASLAGAAGQDARLYVRQDA